MPKTIVVTGANRGIGLAIAEELARRGERVILTARSPEQGEQARDALQRADPGQDHQVVCGDLSSIAATHKLAHGLVAACERIDVFIHNAGIWPDRKVLTPDGFEQAFMVNHLAPFLLNQILAEGFQQWCTRVVQVSAGLYVMGRIDLDRTPTGDNFSRLRTYATTKLCNLITTMELARRLSKTGVTVNACHPGVIRTGLGESRGLATLIMRLVKKLWKKPAAGARAPVHLALAPELDGRSGLYFDQMNEAPLQPIATDAELATQLWEQAEQLLAAVQQQVG